MLKTLSITASQLLSSLPVESWIKQIPVPSWIVWITVQHEVLILIGKSCLSVHPKLRWLPHNLPVEAAGNQGQANHCVKLNELNEFGETEVKGMEPYLSIVLVVANRLLASEAWPGDAGFGAASE